MNVGGNIRCLQMSTLIPDIDTSRYQLTRASGWGLIKAGRLDSMERPSNHKPLARVIENDGVTGKGESESESESEIGNSKPLVTI